MTTESTRRDPNVDHPDHYNVGGIEAWGCGFNDGSAIKYIARYKYKGNPIEDLKKARWYIDREIQRPEKGK